MRGVRFPFEKTLKNVHIVLFRPFSLCVLRLSSLNAGCQGIKLYNRSAFTITSGQCCPGQRSQSHLDMCTVSVSDQSTTCIRWVFTTKARHVYGGYSQKSWTCLPAVFTIKAGHVCCPDQCSRSKLDMSAVSVHDQSWACLP